MTLTADTTIPASPPESEMPRPRKGRWIDEWDPDNEVFWEATGHRIARKNLALSMFSEHIGFSVWVVWTIVVINLANIGIALSVSQLFLLTLVPNLVGAVLRIPYTFAVPRFGGRAWTAFSAAMLLLPAVLLGVVVPSGWLLHQSHNAQLWILFACAATSGLGGGNFASSMANISFFYPERKKGFALGLNAAGGNLGVAVAQLFVPLVLIIGLSDAAARNAKHHVHMAYAGWMWVPFIVIAVVCAWRYMDSLSQARTDTSSYRASLRLAHTWIISLLYIGTFGSFIGFSFALPLVIKNTFPDFLAGHPFIATYLAGLGFVGALAGSLSRPIGGWLADRVGGARVTLGVFVGMAGATTVAVAGVESRSFPTFFVSFLVIFVVAGIGNGSTYKMIPAILSILGRAEAGRTGADPAGAALECKRRSAAVIGIAGAIGALGGVLIQVVLRQASLGVSAQVQRAKTPAAKLAVATKHANWSVPALWVFFASYVVLAGVTWVIYVRRDAAVVRGASAAAATL